jgi:hypothetical protein
MIQLPGDAVTLFLVRADGIAADLIYDKLRAETNYLLLSTNGS